MAGPGWLAAAEAPRRVEIGPSSTERGRVDRSAQEGNPARAAGGSGRDHGTMRIGPAKGRSPAVGTPAWRDSGGGHRGGPVAIRRSCGRTKCGAVGRGRLGGWPIYSPHSRETCWRRTSRHVLPRSTGRCADRGVGVGRPAIAGPGQLFRPARQGAETRKTVAVQLRVEIGGVAADGIRSSPCVRRRAKHAVAGLGVVR